MTAQAYRNEPHGRRLRREAMESATWRGHQMGRWEIILGGGTGAHRQQATCKKCGKQVVVDTNPPPNGIDIGGEAVALGCKDS